MKTFSIEMIDFDIQKANENWWNQIMSLFLNPGQEFEIRHWREEKAATSNHRANKKILRLCRILRINIRSSL